MVGETSLAILLASMDPVLDPAEYVWASVADTSHPAVSDALAIMKEDEGVTLVMAREIAVRHGLAIEFPSRRIVLRVHSSLEAVGLTAAFSGALARQGVSANVVAGFYHDHIFVPASRADEALEALRSLADESK